MEKEYRCAIIGQHPMRFPWGFDEEDTQCRRMKLELAQCIMELRQCGVTEFQVACDPGVGLYAGEIVNITKQNDEAMRLVCVTLLKNRLPSGRRSCVNAISICWQTAPTFPV